MSEITHNPSPSGEGQGVGSAEEARCLRSAFESEQKSLGRADARTHPNPSLEREGLRTDWTRAEIAALFDLPLLDLLYRAQTVHRAHHPANQVQLSTLLSIKTGGCPEDCGYCSQSAHHDTGLGATKLMDTDAVLAAAAEARASGSGRFCMGAAWRNPKDRDIDSLCDMVAGVKAMGLETCMTLGMLTQHQADRLAAAGLDYYNHNIDTAPEHYGAIITTRTFQDRLDTLEAVRASGMSVCCGGIVGMGETREDRVGFIHALATLPEHPGSVPINALVPVRGTPLGDMLADTPLAKIDEIEFVRTVAVARITMPQSMVRLSAGRESMSESAQALCFMAGANSIFTGDKLLTTGNAGANADAALFAKLGLQAMDTPPARHPGLDPGSTCFTEAEQEQVDAGSSPA